jgi:hypothetical protein
MPLQCSNCGARGAATRAALLFSALFCALRGGSCLDIINGIAATSLDAAPAQLHAAAAQRAAADAALSAPLAAMVEAVGALLDSCSPSQELGGALSASASGVDVARLADDMAAVDAALRRCGVAADGESDDDSGSAALRVMMPGGPTAHDAAESTALRARLRDAERDAEALRERAAACKSDAPPPAGAALLHGWLRGARRALEASPDCLTPDTPQTCGCGRAVAGAVAATFALTSAAAFAIFALLRSRPQPAGAPRRRLRGAAVLGLARAADAASPTAEAASDGAKRLIRQQVEP